MCCVLSSMLQVVVFQQYFNDGSEAIETKYAFPLDEMAAVCGFEAFINGKHIIGEIKERNQAHKEYEHAIKEGHGGYLMDEEDQVRLQRAEIEIRSYTTIIGIIFAL